MTLRTVLEVLRADYMANVKNIVRGKKGEELIKLSYFITLHTNNVFGYIGRTLKREHHHFAVALYLTHLISDSLVHLEF